MKVILLETVAGLGRIDEVKDVTEGYARNFLFPRHLAVQAFPDTLAKISARQTKKSATAEAELRRQEQLAEQLDGLEIQLTEKTNDQGVLYAAIPVPKIVAALRERGYSLAKSEIVAPSIKALGDHKVKIKLKHGLEADITVRVLAATP